MKKKIVIFLSLFIIVLLSWNFYQQKTKTVECWWGVIYPSLSFIGFEDNTKVSSTASKNEHEFSTYESISDLNSLVVSYNSTNSFTVTSFYYKK